MQWSPRPAETAALMAVGVGLALGTVAVDTPGRILLGAAALMVLGIAAHDLLLRPRLAIRASGVVVRQLSGRRELPWAELRVRVRTARRLGVATHALELDITAGPDDDGALVVLGRRDLGADPAEVAAALRAFDPRRP